QRLAVRYLKADVEPPPKPVAAVTGATLQKYEGYYHDANPRNQAFAFVQWLLSGRTISVDSNHLKATPVFGQPSALIPVSDTLFRLENEPDPILVFVPGQGDQMILTGAGTYAERWPRWRIDVVRWTVFGSAAIVVTPIVMLVPWLIFVRRSPGFWWLKTFLLLCAIAFVLPVLVVMNVADRDLGTRNIWTMAMFAGSVLMPAAAVLSFLFVIDAWRNGASGWLRAYSLIVSIAVLVISGYLSAWGMLAF